MNAIIRCVGLSKTYQNGVTALDNLHLTIEEGMSFGLMGENGAGKSTLVRLLMGFIFPTKGSLQVLGHVSMYGRGATRDPRGRPGFPHASIGYLHERPYVELRFTARRYLTYIAELSGLWGSANRQRVSSVLEQVDLAASANEKLSTYSKGMLQRLSIAGTLLTDPRLLILDEPTNGLDPYSQWKARQIIAALRSQGKTIFICSHYLAEVEMLCDTVGILQRGRLIRQGAVADLVHTRDTVEILLADGQDATDIAHRLGITAHTLAMQHNLMRIPATAQQTVLSALVGAAIPIHELHPVSQTLEEVYIHATRPQEETPVIT